MVNIDTVYQRVLALANKEQRGYITPQEFNLFANQAQMDIFEQYFYDLSQFLRIPGNSTEHADTVSILQEKINVFESSVSYSYSNFTETPGDLYRISTLSHDLNGKNIMVEKVSQKQLNSLSAGSLTAPSERYPVYTLKNKIIKIYPDISGHITINYIRKPLSAKWSYVVVGEKPLVNTSAYDYQHFELHPSEETKLVVKILSLAGVTLKDNNLYQIASAEDNKNIQQEKQ